MKRLVVCKNKTYAYLVILLMAAIMFVCQTTASNMKVEAAALTDVRNTPYETAANRLNQLGVMVGDQGGFRANDKIKRSEFTAVVMRVLGLEESAKSNNQDTNFDDVKKGHWASGYISLAASQGIIKGMDDHTFSPDSDVTYEQAVAILIRALGYEPAVTGSWPDGYLSCAASIGLTRDVILATGTSIIRGDIARLTDKALEIPMLVAGAYKKGKQSYIKSGKNGTDEETLLESKMKLTKYLVQILDINSSAAGNSMRVKIIEAKKDKTDEGKTENYSFDLSIIGSGTAAALINTNATIYVKDKELFSFKPESEVLYGTIFEINGKSKKESLTSLTKFSEIKDIHLKNRHESYDVSPQVTIKKNNLVYNGSITDLLNQYARIILKDGQISEMDVFAFNEAGIVISASRNEIKFTQADNGTANMEITEEMGNKPDAVTIVLDGNIAKVDDIKQGMFFDAWYDSEKVWLVLMASSKSLMGRVDAFDGQNQKIRIEGVGYDISDRGLCGSADNGASFSSTVINDEFVNRMVAAYFDCKGDVRYMVTKADGGTLEFYGVVKKYYEDSVPYAKIIRGVNNATVEVNMELKLDRNSLAKVKNSAGNPDGSSVFKFTPNAQGQIIGVESLNLYPYALHYNPNNIEDYVFKNRLEDPKSDNKVTQILYDDITDAQLKGWQITLKPQALNNADGSILDTARYVQFYKDAQVFSLSDQDGNFNPTFVPLADFAKCSVDMLTLIVGLEEPWNNPFTLSATIADNVPVPFAKVFIIRRGYDFSRMKSPTVGIITDINKTDHDTNEVTQSTIENSGLESIKCKISDKNMQGVRFSLITDSSNTLEYGRMVKISADVNGASIRPKVGDLAYIFRDFSGNGINRIGPARIDEVFDMDSIKEGFNTVAQTVYKTKNGRYLFTDCDYIDFRFVKKDFPTTYTIVSGNCPIYEYIPGRGGIEFVQRHFSDIKPGDKVIVTLGNPTNGEGKYGTEVRAIIFKKQ